MSTLAHNPWLPRAGSFAVWLLAAGCAVYWGLKLPAASGAAAPAPVPAGPTVPADPAAVARLLGATAAAPGAGPAAVPAQSSRFALVGVVSGRSEGGAALIAVGGFMSLAARLRRRSPAPATSAETPASDGAGEKAPAGAIA